jgi:YbbR domain-containing protein
MKKFLGFVWGIFRNNLLLKIMAVLFAVILWSYVLTATNPPRERTVGDVTVRYQHMEELLAKGLAISGSLSDALNDVDVRVEINQNEVRYLSDENVEAYIDLSTINGTGTHTLKVSAQTTYGEVLEVMPSKVELVIEDYVTKTVPVNVNVTGSVPSGFYASDPVISPGVISVSGARGDVEKVTNGMCEISLDGLTEGYNKSVDVILLNDSGEVVDNALFTGDLPSVIVDLVIRPMKSVPVDVESAIIGTDDLEPGYEITDITCDPQRVNIVGEQSVLDGISAISLVQYSVSRNSKDVSVPLAYDVPEGVEVLDSTQAQVYISIREVTDVVSFKDVDISVKNVPHGMTAQLDTRSIDVVVMAGLSKLSQLERSDIVPYIDLEGYDAGTYTLSIQYELPEGFTVENFSSAVETVTVTLTR